MAIEWSAALRRSALAAAILATLAAPALAAPVKTGHVELELFAASSAAPGQTVAIGLRQTIAPGWHTYWRNPGDAGEATQIDWTLPKTWTAGPILWPTPGRALTGPLMNYVYSDTVVLPSQIRVADDAKPGARATIKAHVSLLVCKDVCVPEEASLSLDLPVTARPTADAGAAAIGVALRQAPDKAGGEAKAWRGGDRVILSIPSPDIVRAAKRAAEGDIYFYPFSGTVIDHAKAQTAEVQGDSLRLILPAGYDFTHGKAPARLAGVVAFGGKGWEIDAGVGPEPSLTAQAPQAKAAPSAAASKLAPADAPPAPPAVDPLGLPAAVALAFLGGLILNRMPCVFPVLSMKAAALSRHGGRAGAARAEGIAYLVGVVLTFLGLAAALIAARRAGEAVGWGFQLQSPVTVSVLTLVMLASALNLSGLFEIGLSAQGAGSDLAAKPGLAGAFFTGVLAVVVAAPCTGPFMATTIGWALAQPEIAALSVFASLGLGLAFPFVALAFVPRLQALLPRPGAWMSGLRKVLAFPMYGAAAWLAWVFAAQSGTDAMPALYAAALLLAFALWLWGVGQRGGRGAAAGAVVALIASVAALSFAQKASKSQTASSASAGVEVWSPARVAELQAKGRPIFVDFTAAWCVTCKVNEAGALSAPQVKDAFKRTGTVYLRADWTRRDAEIAHALQAQGRAGVPLYLVYDRKGGAPRVLPQLLQAGEVVEALETATR
jgi:thiol:disulfide interchange protein/DsbC/DsbD-like thiol-disulfide interchange protein